MVHVPYSGFNITNAIVCTRLDITYVISVMIRYMDHLLKGYWQTVKWIRRNLNNTPNSCLVFNGDDLGMTGYVDSGYPGDLDEKLFSHKIFVYHGIYSS